VALALGIAAGVAIAIGVLATRAWGIVFFAAAVVTGIAFELAGREEDRRLGLREAAQAPHPHGASGAKRHLLVVAEEQLAGEALRAQLLAAGGADFELDVLAPVMASRAHHLASDVDREREEARQRLEDSLAWAAEHGFAAKGEIGDAYALDAIEDALRDFGADEVLIVTHPRHRTSWLARRMLDRLERELDVPVREVVVETADAG
jgi:hypothetical protein